MLRGVNLARLGNITIIRDQGPVKWQKCNLIPRVSLSWQGERDPGNEVGRSALETFKELNIRWEVNSRV